MSDAIQSGSPAEVPPLLLHICIGWGLGTLGLQTLLQVVNVLILKYLIDILGVTAAVAGIIIASTRIYDAFIDPLMGTISDQTQSRWGRRRPFLLIGAFLCALCPIMLFVAPQWIPPHLLVAYITIGLLVYATAYTIYNVPLLAMPVEMTPNPSERTYLFTFRMYGFSIGTLLGGSLAAWLVGQYGDSQAGYAIMGTVIAGIVLISCLGAFWLTAKAPVATVDISNRSPKLKQFKTAFQNKPLRSLLLIKIFLVSGVGVSGGGLAFFVTTVMERSLSIFPIFGLSLTAGLMISQSLWLSLARRVGKRRCYLIAATIYASGALSWLLSGPEETLWTFGVRALVLGFGAGGALLSSQSMLPDVLDHEVKRSNIRNEGVLTGLFSTAERGSSALGIAIAGLILSAGGYISGNTDAVQPSSAITAIYICVGLGPCIGILLSMIAAWRYDLPG